MKFHAIKLCFGIILLVSTINSYKKRRESSGPTGSSAIHCPNGEPVTANCNLTDVVTCPDDKICYAAKTKNVCCPKNPSFCDLTGMLSYFDRDDQGPAQIFKYEITRSKTPYFYGQYVGHVDIKPACPIPLSLLFIEKYKAKTNYHVEITIIASALQGLDQLDPLPKCEKNSDCDENSFCGDVYNESNNETLEGRDEQNIKFCFKIPPVPVPYNTTTKYIKLADKYNLITCDNHEECYISSGDASSFCYKKHGHNKLTYFVKNGDVYERKLKDGLCMTSKICVDANKVGRFKWEHAAAPYHNIDGCESDENCEGGGKTRPSLNPTNIIYNPLCIKNKAMSDIGVCCYEIISQCDPGITATPSISCAESDLADDETNFEKCNGNIEMLKKQQTPAVKWCDDNTKICCKQDRNTIQWCDDGATPLFNEPNCTEYDPSVITSGICEQKGATCKYGHCCPKVTIDPITNNKTIPEYTYTTRYPCIPGERPPLFSMGFCDPKTEKVVILGYKSSKTGEPLTHFPRETPTSCVKDIDCSYDNSTLCLYKETTGKCFYNPMEPLPSPSNAVWIGLLITSIILAVVFLAISIGLMYLYGPKSVFDKYKPNKNSEDAKNTSGIVDKESVKK